MFSSQRRKNCPFGLSVPQVGGFRASDISTPSNSTRTIPISTKTKIIKTKDTKPPREVPTGGEATARGVGGVGEKLISPELPIQRRLKQLGSAARLSHFYTQWQQVTSNNFILKIIKYGYKIDFVSEPYQLTFKIRNMSSEYLNICSYKIKKFLANGAIKVVQPSPDQFLSNIFPVPKKSL